MRRNAKPHTRRILAAWAACALLPALLLGCRTKAPTKWRYVPPGYQPEQKAKTVTRYLAGATVSSVNREHGYILMECIALPSAGEEARVFRAHRMVARVRISSQRRGLFVTADILEGDPQRGDTVKLKHEITIMNPEEETR